MLVLVYIGRFYKEANSGMFHLSHHEWFLELIHPNAPEELLSTFGTGSDVLTLHGWKAQL